MTSKEKERERQLNVEVENKVPIERGKRQAHIHRHTQCKTQSPWSEREREKAGPSERLTRTHQMIHDDIHRSKTTIASTFNICESHYGMVYGVHYVCGNSFDQVSIQAAGSPTRLFFLQLSQSIASKMFHLFIFSSLVVVGIAFLRHSVPVCLLGVSVSVYLDKTRTAPSITNAAVARYGCRCQCNADIINFTVKHNGFHVPHPAPGIEHSDVCMCVCASVRVFVCMFFSVRHLCFSNVIAFFSVDSAFCLPLLLQLLPLYCGACAVGISPTGQLKNSG